MDFGEYAEYLISEANNNVFLFRGKLLHFISIVKNIVLSFLDISEYYSAAVLLAER